MNCHGYRVLGILSAALLVSACGGGGSGGETATAPSPQIARVAASVIVIPATAVPEFVFLPETNQISTSNTTPLPVGSVVQVGERIIKISARSTDGSATQYVWDVPTLDEAYDELNISVDVLEAKVPVVTIDTPAPRSDQVLKAGLDCKPTIVFPAGGGGGLRVDCTAPVVGSSSLSVSATASVKYEGIKIIKAGKGSPVTQEWKMTLQVEPEVGFRWSAKDVLKTTPAELLMKSIPECAAAGLLKVLGRPISAPPAWRTSLGSLPLASSGILTLSVPACILADAGDSKIGVDIVGKGKWKLSVVKLKDAEMPTVSSDFSADIGKAAVDSVTGLNAEAKLKARLELTPMLHFGFVPVSGMYLSPGINIKATAKATLLKQGICGSVSFNSDVQFWTAAIGRKDYPAVEIGLISDKLLLGDTCDPKVDPSAPSPGLTLACDASFEPYLTSLPAFGSAELRNTVAGARLDAASFIANPGSTTLAQIDQQAAQYRSTQSELERLYLQVNNGEPVSQLCAASVAAQSTAGLVDSVAIAWGSVRIGIALDTWGSNRLQCMQSGGTFQPTSIESYCPR